MTILFANNASSVLAHDISQSASSIEVSAGDGTLFPLPQAGEYFLCTLANELNQVEIVKATARDGDILTVMRGQESSTARAYATGDRIELRLTSATLGNFLQLGDLDAAKASTIKNVDFVSASPDIANHGDPQEQGSLARAVEQAGEAPTLIELPGNHVYALNTSLTIPANVGLRFQPGAVIELSPATTLTMYGEIFAGRQRIFSGEGLVRGNLANTPALPQWWGAKADGLCDDTEALNKAAAFKRVYLPLGTYLVRSPVNLGSAQSISGEAWYSGYIDWADDFEQFSPSYQGAASIIQYDVGLHGALFTAKDGVSFENLVFRCGQNRTSGDAFYSGPADGLAIRQCRFENLAEVICDAGFSQAFGNTITRGCLFFACENVFQGALVDMRVSDCLFTSCGTVLHLGEGAGFNTLNANRFEWCDIAVNAYKSRSNSISANLFDSMNETAIRLYDSTDNAVTGNTFWRNGRHGAAAGKRSHIHLKGSASSDNRITGNAFIAGADDGTPSPDRPEYLLEIESAPNTYNTFHENASISSCVDKPVMDTYMNSGGAVFFDDLHIKGIGNPGTAADALANMLKHISNPAAGPVNVHLYEDRRFSAYENFRAGVIKLVGHGSVSITNSNGQSTKLLSIENITYGPAFAGRIGLSSANGAPTAGHWLKGSVVWNSSPSAGGKIGWVCVADGAPGTWKSFGGIAA
jgi:hypothetical protein